MNQSQSDSDVKIKQNYMMSLEISENEYEELFMLSNKNF